LSPDVKERTRNAEDSDSLVKYDDKFRFKSGKVVPLDIKKGTPLETKKQITPFKPRVNYNDLQSLVNYNEREKRFFDHNISIYLVTFFYLDSIISYEGLSKISVLLEPSQSRHIRNVLSVVTV
jgi:hypothetical protein